MLSKERASGFAAMDREEQRKIASKGGKAAHRQGRAHQFTTEQAREAGRKGGLAISRNRDHMAQIGRKGGHAVSTDRAHMAEIGRKGGAAASESARQKTDEPKDETDQGVEPVVETAVAS
jgi:general stress protein YciG